MKREILQLKQIGHCCCPVHDKFPCNVYKNRRSKKARAKFKVIEHKAARAISKRFLMQEIKSGDFKNERRIRKEW